MVAVGVFEVQNIGGNGDEYASLPRHHARGLQEVVDEQRGGFEAPVAVLVFEEADAAAGLLPFVGVEGVVEHLANPQVAVFVEGNVDRVDHFGLGGNDLDAKPFDDLHRLGRLLRWRGVGVVGAFFRLARGATETEKSHQRRERADG